MQATKVLEVWESTWEPVELVAAQVRQFGCHQPMTLVELLEVDCVAVRWQVSSGML